VKSLGAPALIAGLLAVGCAPGSPCRSTDFKNIRRYSERYVGRWTVAHGDTLTLAQMGDRFHLASFALDTDTVMFNKECHLSGRMIFTLPAETLAVSWFGVPEHATIFGWPDNLGPFAGASVTFWGRDSLHGTVLFDQAMDIQVTQGTTAQFWAGKAGVRKP
jgi:hypothetical protein